MFESLRCSVYLQRDTVLELGRTVKRSLENDGMIAWQYGTIGVSDGITMGHEGLFSDILQ